MHTTPIDLTLTELKDATDAADRFIESYGDCGLAFETILTLCFVKALAASTPAQAAPKNAITEAIARRVSGAAGQAIPDWFAEGVKQFQGRKLTASQLLTAMQRPADMKALRDAGAWLRQLYGEPMRSGGQTLFIIGGTAPGAQPQDDDDQDNENAFAPGIPLASKAISFMLQRQEGSYKPEEIAHQLGHAGTAKEVMEIGKALTDNKFPYDHATGTFSAAKVR